MKLGASEIVLIIIVALFVIGPDKLPGYAKKLGKGLSSLKESSNQLASEIRENVTEPLQDIVEPLQEIAEPIREISKPLDEATRSLREIGKPRPKAVKEAAAITDQETVQTTEPSGEALYDVTEQASDAAPETAAAEAVILTKPESGAAFEADAPEPVGSEDAKPVMDEVLEPVMEEASEPVSAGEPEAAEEPAAAEEPEPAKDNTI